MEEDFDPPHHSKNSFFYSSDFDSACSTPYVSAPSSPGRHSSAANSACVGVGGGFFYSAPTSPMHFLLSNSFVKPSLPEASNSNSFEFDFLGDPIPTVGSMSSADELFLNGQIRPIKLKSHLQRPQKLSPLIDLEEMETEGETREDEGGRGREAKGRDRRRARSMSPLRNSMNWHRIGKDAEKCEIKEEDEEEEEDEETVATMSASSSRSSSGGRNSKRWIFLKELLYRSKSEGRNNTSNNSSNRFWNNLSLKVKKAEKSSPVKDNEASVASLSSSSKESVATSSVKKKAGPTNGVGKRRVPASAHEMHYKANRAQSEEMRKKTFLPYRQGLIGCLGFSSKSYGAVNGLARALNPVSSR